MYLYCIVILYCLLKEVSLRRNFQLGPGKVSVVRRCPLRTVRYIENSSYEANPFLSAIERFHCISTLSRKMLSRDQILKVASVKSVIPDKKVF